jgi:hypothetical protein
MDKCVFCQESVLLFQPTTNILDQYAYHMYLYSLRTRHFTVWHFVFYIFWSEIYKIAIAAFLEQKLSFKMS